MADNNKAEAWRESAHSAHEWVVDFSRGGVQAIGRHPILVQEVAITIPFDALLQLVGSLFQLMDARQPAHAVVRAALLGDSDPKLANELRAGLLNAPPHSVQ